MSKEENEGALLALSIFTQKYDPATPGKETDQFTSREIQDIIEKHTGTLINLGELHNLLREMRFDYQLEDSEFVWLCCKTV